jgi:hypothetical protein
MSGSTEFLMHGAAPNLRTMPEFLIAFMIDVSALLLDGLQQVFCRLHS